MDRVAQLIATAEETRRKIWASLPFHVRFAEVMYRLGSQAAADAFGTGMYALFIQQGVQGMPDINGRPADSFEGKRLPTAYGRAFGKKTFAILMSKHRNKNLVEDIMSAVLVYFMEKPERIKGEYKLKSAESFVIKKADWKGLDILRRTGKKVEQYDSAPLDEDGDFGPSTVDVAPDRVKKRYTLEEAMTYVLSRHDVKNALQRIHPSAEEYVRLSLDGYTDRAIFGDEEQGIPSKLTYNTTTSGGRLYPSKWNQNQKKKISQVLNDAYEKLLAMDLVPEVVKGIAV